MAMTQAEYDEQRFTLLNTIADRIKNVEITSKKMTDFEDALNIRTLIKRMEDDLKLCEKCYQAIQLLDNEEIKD